jgi:hypothetical protein
MLLRRSWSWRRNTEATAAKPSAPARTSWHRLRRSQRIGRQMPCCGMTRKKVPAHYRHGVFIAFHGSSDRAPYSQGGYNVVFQPLDGERASGECEVFADGFAGAVKSPAQAEHRPSGLAVGPDGSLYVSRRRAWTDLPNRLSGRCGLRCNEGHEMSESVSSGGQYHRDGRPAPRGHAPRCRCGDPHSCRPARCDASNG